MTQRVEIKDIISCIEDTAPLHWQEDYDNAGLITGDREKECSGVLVCLDVFADTVKEAIDKNCNLIISHHPFIFRGIKKIIYGSETQQILSLVLKNDIAIYASHTNMDSSFTGVNFVLADKLGLQTLEPIDNGRYADDKNYLGEGACGLLANGIKAKDFLTHVKEVLNLPVIRYIGDTNRTVKKVGLCGGSGSFLIEKAIAKHCDIFLTGDIKYHDFLSSENRIILADTGHFESECFIKQRIIDIISKKMCNFAHLYISEETNRVKFL